jgi:methyl coenzyme M reductase system subunit A2
MLALQLISRPEILLLDEPFGDLDPITLRTVTNSLKKLAKRLNFTVIMVSHNTDFVKEFSNRAVFMNDGRILNDGEPNKLVEDFIDFCHADYLK